MQSYSCEKNSWTIQRTELTLINVVRPGVLQAKSNVFVQLYITDIYFTGWWGVDDNKKEWLEISQF